MDPVSVIGLLATAGTIAATVTCTIKDLSQLRGQYEDADLRIRLLIGELSAVKSALTQIHDWTHYLDEGHKQRDVLEGLQISLDGCQLAMDALAGEINLLLIGTSSGQGSDTGFKRRAKYAWNENTLKEHENRLRAQMSALQLLLQAVQCTSRPEQAKLMHAPTSRRIIQKVADDTSSMRATISASQSSRAPTIRSYEESVIDEQTFDWDDEIVNSATYRRTLNHARSKSTPVSPMMQEDKQDSSSQTATEESIEQRSSAGDPQSASSPRQKPLPYDMSITSEPRAAYARRSQAALPTMQHSKSSDKRQNPLVYRIKSTDSEKKSFWRSLSSKRANRNTSIPELNPKPSQNLGSRRGRRGFENSSYTSIDFGSEDGLSAPAIVRAAQAGSVVEVDMLLNQRSDIHARHLQSGRNALAVASHCGNEEVVALLLQHGSRVDDQDALSMTPLHLASSRGHDGVADLLLQEGADVDAKGPDSQTPLRIAAEKGHVVLATTLLSWKAKVNARDAKQMTSLHVAAKQGDESMTEILLSHGAHVEAKDADFKGAIHYASEGGFEQVLSRLLADKADIDAPGKASMTPLLCAASSGQVQVVEFLLKRKASLKYKGEGDMTALHWASYNGHVEVLDLLLQKKAPVAAVNKDGRSALHLAVLSGNFAAAELLLRKGANVEAQCNSMRRPMHYACINSNLEIARLLLGHNASIEEEDGTGKRPLHIACMNSSLPFVEMLIEKGVNIEARDADGDRPLCLASILGHIDIVRLLLNRGAVLRMKYSSGQSHEDSPLCLAAQKGHLLVVEELIVRGSSVLQKDEHNWQPLRHAAYNAHPEVVELLLKNGATVSGNASGGWGFNVTAQRIGFANDLTDKQQRKGEVLRLLTTAEANEQRSQEQQVMTASTAPAVQNQTVPSELPSTDGATTPTSNVTSNVKPGTLASTPAPLSELAPHAPKFDEKDLSLNGNTPKRANEAAAPEIIASQFSTTSPNPPTVPSPMSQQYNVYPPNHYQQQAGPPLPNTYNYNYAGQYPAYPPGFLNSHVAMPPGAYYNLPYFNQPNAPISPMYAPPFTGASPAQPVAMSPDGMVALGSDGTWQRVAPPNQQPPEPPTNVMPDVKRPPTPVYPVGVHEMPS